MVFFDLAYGQLCNWLLAHSKKSDSRQAYVISNEVDADLVILGSSKAVHHYVPSVMEDSLHCTVYNAGMEGMGIVLMSIRLKQILQYHTPKYVIYDVSPYDIEYSDNVKFLAPVKKFFPDDAVKDAVKRIDEMECWKLYSGMYRYNSSILQLISDYFPPCDDSNRGYKPINSVMQSAPEGKVPEFGKNYNMEWDSVKKESFQELVGICKQKGITLICAISPFYGADTSENYMPFMNYCTENRIPVIDSYSYDVINSKLNFYADTSHLNEEGAEIYTSYVCTLLKSDDCLAYKY